MVEHHVHPLPVGGLSHRRDNVFVVVIDGQLRAQLHRLSPFVGTTRCGDDPTVHGSGNLDPKAAHPRTSSHHQHGLPRLDLGLLDEGLMG